VNRKSSPSPVVGVTGAMPPAMRPSSSLVPQVAERSRSRERPSRRLSGPAADSGNTLTLTGAGTIVPAGEFDRVHHAGSGGGAALSSRWPAPGRRWSIAGAPRCAG
jgi:hypothetical protein